MIGETVTGASELNLVVSGEMGAMLGGVALSLIEEQPATSATLGDANGGNSDQYGGGWWRI